MLRYIVRTYKIALPTGHRYAKVVDLLIQRGSRSDKHLHYDHEFE